MKPWVTSSQESGIALCVQVPLYYSVYLSLDKWFSVLQVVSQLVRSAHFLRDFLKAVLCVQPVRRTVRTVQRPANLKGNAVGLTAVADGALPVSKQCRSGV